MKVRIILLDGDGKQSLAIWGISEWAIKGVRKDGKLYARDMRRAAEHSTGLTEDQWPSCRLEITRDTPSWGRPEWGSQEWAETHGDDLGESPDY